MEQLLETNIEKEDLSQIAVQDEDISPQQCLLIKLLSMTDQDDVTTDEENYEKKTKGKANNYKASLNKLFRETNSGSLQYKCFTSVCACQRTCHMTRQDINGKGIILNTYATI